MAAIAAPPAKPLAAVAAPEVDRVPTPAFGPRFTKPRPPSPPANLQPTGCPPFAVDCVRRLPAEAPPPAKPLPTGLPYPTSAPAAAPEADASEAAPEAASAVSDVSSLWELAGCYIDDLETESSPEGSEAEYDFQVQLQ